jgi:hypothetical protein
MVGSGGFQGKPRLITDGGAPGLSCTSSEMIGRRGRLGGTVRCAECREHRESVGGGSVWTRLGRVQSGRPRTGARPGGYSALRCRARVAARRHHHAVQSCVQCEAGRGRGARERGARSGRAGWPNGVALTRSGRGLRPRSCRTVSGNWFLVSSRAWRRGDRA